MRQTDTYFRSAQGRLKLREIASRDGRRAELIRYDRADASVGRASDYTVEPIPDPAATLAALSAEHGVRVVVRKTRQLLIWRNVRLHLDAVDALGTFVELESVVGDGTDEPEARAHFDELFQLLRLGRLTPEPRSYSDLLIEQAS